MATITTTTMPMPLRRKLRASRVPLQAKWRSKRWIWRYSFPSIVVLLRSSIILFIPDPMKSYVPFFTDLILQLHPNLICSFDILQQQQGDYVTLLNTTTEEVDISGWTVGCLHNAGNKNELFTFPEKSVFKVRDLLLPRQIASYFVDSIKSLSIDI